MRIQAKGYIHGMSVVTRGTPRINPGHRMVTVVRWQTPTEAFSVSEQLAGQYTFNLLPLTTNVYTEAGAAAMTLFAGQHVFILFSEHCHGLTGWAMDRIRHVHRDMAVAMQLHCIPQGMADVHQATSSNEHLLVAWLQHFYGIVVAVSLLLVLQ